MGLGKCQGSMHLFIHMILGGGIKDTFSFLVFQLFFFQIDFFNRKEIFLFAGKVVMPQSRKQMKL